MSRQQDLEELIRRSYQVIIANETQMQTEGDPQRRLSQSDRIKENWTLIEGYIQEYVPIILNHPEVALPPDIEQIISRFPSGATLVTEQARVLRRKIVSHWKTWEGITETIDKYQTELKIADTEDKRFQLEEAISGLEQRQKAIELALAQQENMLNEFVLAPNVPAGTEFNKFRIIQVRLESVNTIVDQVDSIINRLPRLLSTQFDRLSQQIEALKKELMIAINEGRRSDIEDLSRELDMQLRQQQERRDRRATAFEAGSGRYQAGLERLQQGAAEEAQQLFAQAEAGFREAIELSTFADPETKGILVSMGNSIAMQGRQEESIPYYELSLQLAPGYEAARGELARRYFEIGYKQFSQRLYGQAARSFELANGLTPSDDYRKWIAVSLNEDANSVLTSLGSAASMLDWDRARFKMLRAIFIEPENEAYHNNLKTMQKVHGPLTVMITRGHQLVEAGALPADEAFMEVYLDEALPPNIASWLQLFLPEFRELAAGVSVDRRRPIHVWWLQPDDTSLPRLSEIGISDLSFINIACSHMVAGAHYLIFNSAYFSSLNDRCLLGTLFHELSHEAWKAIGGSANLPDWTATSATQLASERLADLLTIHKGLGEFLLEARRQLEGAEGVEGDYPALTSAEIARILRRDRESEGKRMIQAGAELLKQEKKDEATGLFAGAANIWKGVVMEDPSYAFGWYELAIALHWLGNVDAAVQNAFIAVTLDRSPKYRAYYERVQFAREEEARKHVVNGAALKKRGQVKKAHQLFQLAEGIWQQMAGMYFNVGRVHYELGLCYEWQDRVDEALQEYLIAASLDRFNPNYAQYLRACAERYSTE